jgi:NAD(P)-dependent dehydrogenase (short-subunit alcohol dehydrogenase family)
MRAAAQGAIEAFTRSAAVELAGKCRLNCVAATGTDETGESGGSEKIAAAVEFFLSNGAAGITGQSLAVEVCANHTL